VPEVQQRRSEWFAGTSKTYRNVGEMHRKSLSGAKSGQLQRHQPDGRFTGWFSPMTARESVGRRTGRQSMDVSLVR
jgi:hypothetical protein